MMGRPKKQYDDDDGRIIADMSQIHPTPMFVPGRPDEASGAGERGKNRASSSDEQERAARPWEDTSLTAKERLMYVLGAMKATLLIAFAYLAGLAAVIWLLLTLWR